MQAGFDRGARALLGRAYAARGAWVGTRLAVPSREVAAQWRARGIDPYGPDPVPRGGLNAHTRWMRAFIRCLYYQHKWWSVTGKADRWRQVKRTVPRHAGALEIDVGRAMPARGIIPAGRAIRVRINAGGQAAQRAVDRLPDSERIYDDRGQPAGRWADPANRDW